MPQSQPEVVRPGQVYVYTPYESNGLQYHVLAVYEEHAWVLRVGPGRPGGPDTMPVTFLTQRKMRLKYDREDTSV